MVDVTSGIDTMFAPRIIWYVANFFGFLLLICHLLIPLFYLRRFVRWAMTPPRVIRRKSVAVARVMQASGSLLIANYYVYALLQGSGKLGEIDWAWQLLFRLGLALFVTAYVYLSAEFGESS